MSSFEDLQLANWIRQQLKTIGVERPTPIQSACIPAILSGRDVLGVAQTGSGKTLAFALPVLHTLSQDPYGIYALVVTPTRELAYQIADQFKVVGKKMNLRDCVIVGGFDIVKQARELEQRPHVVIATPGRLSDHLRGNPTFSLKNIKYLILDEADRLLDGQFDEHLNPILAALPKKRQTLLFTATLTDSLEQLKSVAMKEPFFFQAESKQATVDQLDQRYVLTPVEARDGYLVHLVQTIQDDSHGRSSMIIFVKTCRQCEVLSMTLKVFDFQNVSLHSNKPQRDRLIALSKFKSNQSRVLIATDVASRGLDIPTVDVVINHDVPRAGKNYVHRVGRTARAGRAGRAITLVTPHDVSLIKNIEENIRTKLSEMTVDDEAVAEILTQVNVTRREQEMKLSEMDFEEKRAVNKRKKMILEGLDPDVEEKRTRKVRREKVRTLRREQRRKDAKKEEKS